MVLIFYILVAAALVTNLLAEFARDLMMLQQNSYRNERYLRWLRTSGDSTSYPRLIGLCVAFLSMVSFVGQLPIMILMGIFGFVNASFLLRKKYKKPLVWTRRVRRIFTAMILLALIVCALVFCISRKFGSIDYAAFNCLIAILFSYCASHIFAMLAIIILSPVEKAINRKFYNEAAAKLRSIPGLTVIGVTGSYGKTSTKHYLERILSEKFDVLMTPGSFNTTLGVIRTIREMMKPYTEVFICEMGAKQPNDIKEICDLVHPQIGVITAVGPQHLESFKTIENVQRTKFELADALPADGLLVVNNDFPFIANREVTNTTCVRYGVATGGSAVDFRAENITYSPTGTTFTIKGGEREIQFHTRLVGECNVSNLLAAVIVALYLEVPEDKIRYAVEKIEQVEHRLTIKRTPGGITIIDDAYNSNPTGSAMALDVLAAMTQGTRFIITPGMIELGPEQFALNKAFGEKIARSVDVAIIVGNYNHQAITEGIEQAGVSNVKVISAATFNEAQQTMTSMARPGDTVLYENDLPDTFK
ncbi:MAG: UDP-N-acetylmuramoyl-tripeptide--D-alanyl-D-alanine ligase [Bacteroides sp.]|nr:UDP-N-acetylmuramoyl-tripeptide--D-alanyl-D-alanine ligase [Bacteroides sp.]